MSEMKGSVCDPSLKKIRRLTLAVLAVGFTLYAAVLVPLYTQLWANVVYRDGWLCLLLPYLYTAVDLLVFFWVYAAAAYSLYRGGWRAVGRLSALYGGMIVYKYVANYVVGSLVDGAFSSWELFWRDDFPIIGGELFWEIAQYAAVVLLMAAVLKKARRDMLTVFPFVKMLDVRNSMQRAAVVAGLVVTAVRWIMHLLYQFVQLIYNGYNDGWVVITVDVVGDLLIGVIGYFVMVLLLQWFEGMRQKALGKEVNA